MFRKFYDRVLSFIKEEYKTIVFLFIFYIICSFPVNYSIVIGGGISDISSRIHLSKEYKSKGSLNISYVSELKGTLLSYGLSYIMPDWKRVSLDDYKYSSEEDYREISFRNDIDLKSANYHAIKLAYNLAHKDIKLYDNKIYVYATSLEFPTNLKVGDQILAINGQTFSDINLYRDYIQTFDDVDTINIKVKRGKKEIDIKAKIYSYDGRKIIGVSLQQINSYETDPKVNIKFKNRESGPSAGLITTLYIYNKLVKDDITRGKIIAGTGTVDYDGNVGEIGEVKYKLLGAVKKKADVFIVPNGSNYKTCMKLKEKRNLKIKIIGVDTVADALNKLEELK